jgi:hypothetical protein
MDNTIKSFKSQLSERLNIEINKLKMLCPVANHDAVLLLAGRIIELENMIQLCEDIQYPIVKPTNCTS